MVISILGWGQFANQITAERRGRADFGPNSNFGSGDVEGVIMGYS